jgi:MFS family permease
MLRDSQMIGSSLFSWLLAILLFALVGAAIGDRKGRAGAGFFFGALLGPLGWLVIAAGPNYKQVTPVAGAPLVPASTALIELKRLLDVGAITQAEYDAKKASVLERL